MVSWVLLRRPVRGREPSQRRAERGKGLGERMLLQIPPGHPHVFDMAELVRRQVPALEHPHQLLVSHLSGSSEAT